MNKQELNKVLELHKKWLNNEEGGERANLSDADLIDADLCGADFSKANLRGADLRMANLRWADLCVANLSGANLSGADLRGDLTEHDIQIASELWKENEKIRARDRLLINLLYIAGTVSGIILLLLK